MLFRLTRSSTARFMRNGWSICRFSWLAKNIHANSFRFPTNSGKFSLNRNAFHYIFLSHSPLAFPIDRVIKRGGVWKSCRFLCPLALARNLGVGIFGIGVWEVLRGSYSQHWRRPKLLEQRSECSRQALKPLYPPRYLTKWRHWSIPLQANQYYNQQGPKGGTTYT